MIDAYLLRYYLAVVETGGFTKAADRCNVTQPTLSAGIRKLEEQLAATLFDRSSRRVQLTPAGTRFLDRAQSIMREYNLALKDLAENSAPSKQKRLRLGISHTLPTAYVAQLSLALANALESYSLQLSEGTQQELSNRLAQGRLDVAIMIKTGAKPRGDVLFSEGYSLAIADTHPLAQQTRIDAQDLAQDTMIVRRRCEMLQETSQHFTSANVRPPIGYRTTNDDKALALVAAGLGVTVAPDGFTAPGVARIKMTGFRPQRHIVLEGSDDALRSDVAHVLRRPISPAALIDAEA